MYILRFKADVNPMVDGENSDALSAFLPLFTSVYCLLQKNLHQVSEFSCNVHNAYLVNKALDIIGYNSLSFPKALILSASCWSWK